MIFKLGLNNILIISLFIVCVIAKKLKLSVYFESLCPDSRLFITRQLTPTYAVLNKIFDIDLVPYGNSNWSYSETSKEVFFQCQHGQLECQGNKIQVNSNWSLSIFLFVQRVVKYNYFQFSDRNLILVFVVFKLKSWSIRL